MERIYFAVPYLYRTFAKKLGACWDPSVRLWFTDNEEAAVRMRKHYPEHQQQVDIKN